MQTNVVILPTATMCKVTGTMGKPREFKTDKPFFELGPEDCFVKDFLRRLFEKRVQPTTKKRIILAEPANTFAAIPTQRKRDPKLDILVKMAPCYSRRSLQQARDGSSAGSSGTGQAPGHQSWRGTPHVVHRASQGQV